MCMLRISEHAKNKWESKKICILLLSEDFGENIATQINISKCI